ncbi:MAG TPA: hypothetical protein VGC79_27670, partial [Polyangiaceae bacterium]
EYLAHERFSIEAKSMLLIDQPALPLETAVVFDVTLENGQKPIRAEAKVVGYVEPEGDRPGGVRVRFRRFGAATKAFIDRAVNGTAPAPVLEAPAPVLEVAPIAEPAPSHTPLPSNEPGESDEASGIHPKTARTAAEAATKTILAPANREALLARLRGRRAG